VLARDRWLTIAAGIFSALLVVITHEHVKPDWPVQAKALLAGLIGRYLVNFVLQGAKQTTNQSTGIIRAILKKLGVKHDEP